MSERRAPANLSAGDKLEAAPHHVRKQVLALLDEMSAPMTARQIEHALQNVGGLTRSERRKVIQALKRLPIIAIGGG